MSGIGKMSSAAGLLLLLWLTACAASSGAKDGRPAAGEPNVDQAASAAPVRPTAARPTAVPVPPLPDLGAAPEITNEVWINSDEALTLASQRGKVVLIEFWTFG